jgi:AhpC/TSA antioxidant enzyme
MFCREHVVQLHHESGRIQAAGGEVVIVGSGKPEDVAGFRDITHFDGKILCDPRLVSFRAAGLKRGIWKTLGPGVLVSGIRSLAHGHRQGRTQGDAFQQGGVLVILPPGRIIYEHISERAGDNAPATEVAAALENATAERKAS